ncbi:MAG: transglutaminase-like domain-containing protein [Candidatus Bathyarchaeia archaeon]
MASNQEIVEKYRQISMKLSEKQLISKLSDLFERKYTLTELLDWLHERVKFTKGDIVRHNDPLEILAYGKGRCGEFSILFTSLCLAHGYRARLILDMSDHVWTEVWDKKERRWLHVDPSEKRIDDPFMYERDWKKDLREIYAFENGEIENVTEKYKLPKEKSNAKRQD